VTPVQQNITAHGGTTIPVCGTTRLRVWRGKYICKLDCKLVNWKDIRPILGRKACIGMKIVIYLDNDHPNYQSIMHNLCHGEQACPIDIYPSVCGDGVGLLDGRYHVRIHVKVSPVQHTPQCISVAIREQLQVTLERLV